MEFRICRVYYTDFDLKMNKVLFYRCYNSICTTSHTLYEIESCVCGVLGSGRPQWDGREGTGHTDNTTYYYGNISVVRLRPCDPRWLEGNTLFSRKTFSARCCSRWVCVGVINCSMCVCVCVYRLVKSVKLSLAHSTRSQSLPTEMDAVRFSLYSQTPPVNRTDGPLSCRERCSPTGSRVHVSFN